MDLPANIPQTGRGFANTNWTFKVFPTSYNDMVGLVSLYEDRGFPGLTIDVRLTGQPAYTNNIVSTPVSGADNDTLGAPSSPCLFLTEQGSDAGVLGNFIRLALGDIAPDPADGAHRRGVWLQKIYTGEGCNNKNFRYFLCSPLYQDP